MEEEFIEKFENDIWVLGNHSYYGLCKETFQERGNELLGRAQEFLSKNPDISNQKKVEILCHQSWLVGFLSGQNLNIREDFYINCNSINAIPSTTL